MGGTSSAETTDATRTTSGARFLEPRPTPRERLVRTLIAPLSAAGGVATGTGIGLTLGFGLGALADLAFTRPLPPFTLGATLLPIGAVIGGFIGYVMGILGPGRLFEPTLSAQKRAILIGTLIGLAIGGVWLGVFLANVLVPALPFLITGSALVAFAVPPLVDLTRPRVEALTVAEF